MLFFDPFEQFLVDIIFQWNFSYWPLFFSDVVLWNIHYSIHGYPAVFLFFLYKVVYLSWNIFYCYFFVFCLSYGIYCDDMFLQFLGGFLALLFFYDLTRFYFATIDVVLFVNAISVVILITTLNTASIIVQDNFQFFLISVYTFLWNLINLSVSVNNNSFTLIFFCLFMFLCISNLIGIIPHALTVTSHLSVTLFLSLGFFISNNIIGICYHNQRFLNLFLPSGVPVFIIPMLILIEYVSYLSSILSLAVRLFANMVSGHILLNILIGFLWQLVINRGIGRGIICYIIPVCIVFIVIVLEIVIAVLQAYVFIALLVIYLNDAISLHEI